MERLRPGRGDQVRTRRAPDERNCSDKRSGANAKRQGGLKVSIAETPNSGSVPATWHAMSTEEVEKKLRVDPSRGLDAAEAPERLRTYGPNRLPQGKKRGR